MTSTQKKGLKVNEALSKALEGGSELKAKDIIDAALPLTNLSTKTPRATIAHALSVEARKTDGLFERTGPGLYRLRTDAKPKVEKESISPVTDALLEKAGKDDAKPDTKERQTRGSTAKRTSAPRKRGGTRKQPAAA